MGEGSERVEGAPEVKGREGEGCDAAIRGAEDAAPRGGACVCSGPVGEKVAVNVALAAEEGECTSIIVVETEREKG